MQKLVGLDIQENGNLYDLKIKGVKFLSKLHDTVIFGSGGVRWPRVEVVSGISTRPILCHWISRRF